GTKLLDAARGLTQTIRYARRASRSISRATSAGSPRSQPSERITITAPRAMPRRPWRWVKCFGGTPVPGPGCQLGAAAAGARAALDGALGAPRRERPGDARERRREHERLGVAARAREELQVGARVRLHRAGDVAQQHDAAGDDAAAAVREPRRLAAGAQAGAQ